MKNMDIKKLIFCIIGMLVFVNVSAQEVAPPTITAYDFKDQSCIKTVSDNGKWAVSFGSAVSNSSMSTNSRLINIETGEVTAIGLENDETTPLYCMASDVTDDGMVVGEYKGMPATWTKDGGWKMLDLPIGWSGGFLESVTPDGRYAVGRATLDWNESPLLYDLTTGELLDTPGIPVKGSAGEDFKQMRFTSITADGRYISGVGDFSYTWNTVNFIYDREKKSCIRPGFKDDGTSVFDNAYVAEGTFSPNGKFFAGSAVVYTAADEYRCPFTYNMDTGEYKLYNDATGQNYSFITVDNNGVMYGSPSSEVSPVRTLYIFVDGFWYPLDDLLSMRYGIDYYVKTGYDNTGTCIGVSGDGKVLVACPDPYKSYAIKMNETFADAARKVNLLKNYRATPADGAAVTSLRTVEIAFNYSIQLLGKAADIKLTDKDGNSFGRIVSAALQSNNDKVLKITFRSTSLASGENYTLTIPAGMMALKTDASRTNEQIVLHYTGRAASPVKVVSVTPEAGNSLSRLSATTNPVLLTYDTDVKLAEGAKAQLYRDEETEPLAELNLATSTKAEQSKMVMVYPATTQYLFLGSKYKIVVPAGAVTDVNGDNASTEYTVNYEGLYERVIVADDQNLYSEDFNTGVANMMLRDGDGKTPNAEMQGYDFKAGDAYAWVPVRDEGSTDFAAASTSGYDPAGKADDWMVTPQVYIPDAKCRLDFDAQGFRSNKQDKLKVIVYADETVHNYLSAELCAKMRAEGEVVLDQVVLPGNSDENLAGDWTAFSFKLDKYAGKSIYVAFVNENEDQSLVFVDNVKIVRDNGFITALTSETTVVAKESTPVSGRIIVNSVTETFNSISIKLLDAEKNVVDEISESGLSLKKDDKYDFTFSKKLPLTVGKENVMYIATQLGAYSDEVKYTVKDLAFQPVKRVLIEEKTGMGCQFCPQGHFAWEHLSGIYGDKVIMAAYHTYSGDIYESGMTTYTDFLGLNGAPTAKINRGSDVSSPMYYEVREGKYYYTFNSPDGTNWSDLISKEFETDADANLTISGAYDVAASKITVPYSASFALDMDKQNIGMFLIVTEDNLMGYQENYFANQSPENLIGIEDWCKGGKYGSNPVAPYTQNHVVRGIAGSSYYGYTGYLPTSITGGQEYTGNIVFDMPKVNEISNCSVICMMLDANTGRVINVAQAKLTDATGIAGTVTGSNGAEEVARYNAAGQMIEGPQKGLNIIKYADGTTRKVVIK